MANILQKIFLSNRQLKDLDRRQEIMRLVSNGPVHHHASITKNGRIVRYFVVSNIGYNICTSRIYDPSRPEDSQITYNLHYHVDNAGPKYVTHSDIDKTAECVYKKIGRAHV